MKVQLPPSFDLRPGAVNYLHPGMGLFVPVDETTRDPNPPITIRLPFVLRIKGTLNP